MDDITALGLEAMEIQTVRPVQPKHFDQYWQAGILSWDSGIEMNLHGPYYAELLGKRRERNRSLAKMEASMQAGKIINARHLVYHVGPYGEYDPGTGANEQVANIFSGLWTGSERYGANKMRMLTQRSHGFPNKSHH